MEGGSRVVVCFPRASFLLVILLCIIRVPYYELLYLSVVTMCCPRFFLFRSYHIRNNSWTKSGLLTYTFQTANLRACSLTFGLLRLILLAKGDREAQYEQETLLGDQLPRRDSGQRSS